MAIDLNKVRAAIRPQDAVAIIITLLGVAIAIFLGDAIIKFIGLAIAVLGGVALWATLKQRMDDQVQIRQRRTTLPPPAFKTRVTQDPATSTKRIVFDDFQETYNPKDLDIDSREDDEVEEEPTRQRPAAEQRVTEQRAERAAQRPAAPVDTAEHAPEHPAAERPAHERQAPARPVGERPAAKPEPAREQPPAFVEGGGESFRVVNASKSSATSSKPVDQPAARASEPAAKQSQKQSQKPAQTQSGKPAPVNAPAAPEQRRPEPVEASRATAPADVRTAPSAPQSTQPAHAQSVSTHQTSQPVQQQAAMADGRAESAVAEQELLEPVTISAPVEEVRPERTHTRKQAQVILEELIAEGEEDARPGEPRAEFVRLVGQVLTAIARSMPARSIVFFWVNLEKKHVIPEAHVSSGSTDIRDGVRIPLTGDVVSQIARSGVPEIITDISPAAERELITYYAGPADTRSFVGVPVFFRREVVGVLAADSTEESGFDEGSVATLAEYTRLISGLIRGYTEKYDLHLIARTVEAFGRIHRGLTGTMPTPGRIAEILVEEIARLFDSLYVGAVLFDDHAREWRVAAITGGPDAEEIRQLPPDMHISLVGQSTRFAEEILLERLQGEYRFAVEEPLRGEGTFLAIPLVGTTKCYGALAMEHQFPSAYIPRDIDLIRDLVRYASMAIEVYNVNQAIESQVVHDEVTGLYNTDFLMTALDREITRARDLKRRLSFALISIDIPASLRADQSHELEELVVANVGSIIAGAIRPYDTAGMLDGRTFGVVLADRNDQDAYLWAERLRKEVASMLLSAGSRKFSVTISVGICDLSSMTSRAQMIDGATKALERARGGEGNAVILF